MIFFGLGLLGAILLSAGCLVGSISSLLSIRNAYDKESVVMAIAGFIGGIIGSAFFAWVTIKLLNSLESMGQFLSR